jgi:hypothetical protein
VENATGDTWRNTRHELDRMHLVTLATGDGRVAHRSATTPGQKTILAALNLPEPPQFLELFRCGSDAAHLTSRWAIRSLRRVLHCTVATPVTRPRLDRAHSSRGVGENHG